jgi:PAS domain S-box-containing protein
MKEIVQVKLENEMDLILAHKKAMKLAELCGLSLTAQTSIATAVSELARCGIESGTDSDSQLTLGIDTIGGKKYLKAIMHDTAQVTRYTAACAYAKRLVDDIEISPSQKEVVITLKQQLEFPRTLTDLKIESFVDFFKREPPLSSYDEIRKKNLLLQNLADKIRESENDYRTLTDSLPLLMFSVSGSAIITYTNKWLQDFFGAVPQEFRISSWQRFLHADDFSQFSKVLDGAVKNRLPVNAQFRFLQKSTGDYVWHIFSIVPLKTDNGAAAGWIGFMVDIHAQKLVEQTLKDNYELKVAQRQLQDKQRELESKIMELNRSNYELEQFAYLASHDLQEPLRKLFYYSDVLKMQYLKLIDSSGVKMLNSMSAAAHRMKELITDLLTYSQLQHSDFSFQSISLNEILEEVIQEFEITIKSKNAKISIGRLPSIQGNVTKIRQLFRNIISNALKYSKEGTSPEIQIEHVPSDLETIVTISDNGIGFDDKHNEKIFRLFQRLNTKDKYPGTGIGLSACKKIVELHGGDITAHSILNEGSTFRISLPSFTRELNGVLV